MTESRSTHPIHPGEVLADELEELETTAAELARALHVPSNRIYQLVAGKRAMTADTALRLEQRLGVSAGFWMNLQKRYELDVATETTGDEIKRTGLCFPRDYRQTGQFPVSEVGLRPRLSPSCVSRG